MGFYQASNPPRNLRMSDIEAAINGAGPLAKSCRFAVMITPTTNLSVPNDLMYMCESVEFPGRGFDVTQIRYYGPSQVMPNNTMYNTANMQFLCRTMSPERQFFDDWMDYINPTTNFNFEYPDNYYASVNIYQFAEYGADTKATDPIATYGWKLHKAWPTLVNPQQVTWADGDILRLQVTFAYKYWDRPDYSK